MNLWIANLAPDVSDDDLRGLIAKYGAVEVESVKRVPGDGTRPGAIVEVAATPDAVRALCNRLNGMYWRGRSLLAQEMMERANP